jgi:hypothetical protein
VKPSSGLLESLDTPHLLAPTLASTATSTAEEDYVDEQGSIKAEKLI